LASGRAGDTGALMIHADAAVLGGRIAAGGTITHVIEPGRAAYLVPSEGTVVVNGVDVPTRAGVTITDETSITISVANGEAEVVMVDVPLDY